MSETKAPEPVHTMTGYYDGPRSGLANYEGRPHIYDSMFEDQPDSSDTFLIQPIDVETFRLAMEDWAIWGRWERAYHSGQTTLDTHPALPEDRARFEELTAILKPKLQIDEERALRVSGRFDVSKHGERGLTSSVEWVVYWL